MDHGRYASDQNEARKGADRRATDRRAARRGFDPMFVATLVNQIAPPETDYVRGYGEDPVSTRPGLVVNFRA